MRIALIVSRASEFSAQFHSWPEQPVAIIEVRKVTLFARSRWMLQHYAPLNLTSQRLSCAAYCKRHRLQYVAVSPENVSDIGPELKNLSIDLAVTFSVPVLPMSIFSTLRFGAINLHSSLLPAYRGSNPLLWQVIDGVRDSGVSVHCLTKGVDSGDVIAQLKFVRPYAVSRRALRHLVHVQHGIPLLKTTISHWVNGAVTASPQPTISDFNYANNFPLSELLEILDGRDVSLSIVWDLACYLEHWPAEAMNIQGWQTWCRWIPTRVESPCPVCTHRPSERLLEFVKYGRFLHLRHKDGCILFVPRFHAISLLARLLVNR